MAFFCVRQRSLIKLRKFHLYFISYFKRTSIPCNMNISRHFQTTHVPVSTLITCNIYHQANPVIRDARFTNLIPLVL